MKLAVITGAGSGLGRALAVELCRRGTRVAGFGRRLDALQETGRMAGPAFIPMQVDVADAGAVATAFASLPDPVTHLINNAAVYPRRDILDETPDGFMNTVAINLGGVVACTDAALRQMIRTGVGRIMSVGSFADDAPLQASAAYSVSKGAARIYTLALVADLADRFPHIVINDWMPGSLATPMGVANGLDPAIAARWGAELVLMDDPGLTGTLWEMDRELIASRSVKGRIIDRLLLRPRHQARRLG